MKKTLRFALPGLFTFFAAVTVLAQGGDAPASKPAAQTPAAPGLKVGDKAPAATLLTVDGEPVTLASLYATGPVIVTFYRGGWCPYCSKALDEWNQHAEAMKAAAIQAVFVTLEKPERVKSMQGEHGEDLTVLCDPKGETARAFNVLFTMPDDTQAKYRSYKIDLSQINASGTWDLPHPGTFVIDKAGTVRYAFCDTDYKKRAKPDEAIAAAKAAK